MKKLSLFELPFNKTNKQPISPPLKLTNILSWLASIPIVKLPKIFGIYDIIYCNDTLPLFLVQRDENCWHCYLFQLVVPFFDGEAGCSVWLHILDFCVFLGLYIKLDNIWIYEAKKLRANFGNRYRHRV